jgi:amino acid adenylation domain-containing protein
MSRWPDGSRAHVLHELFDAVADATPHRTALVAGEDVFTYGRVRAESDRLAARLVAAGAGPEDVVGVHLERSAAAVIALLAVLKTGAAYLPLPPTHPAGRLEFMAADARCRLAVTGPEHAGGFPLPDVRPIPVGVDTLDPPPVCPPGRPVRPVQPEDVAYVLYTSGSTGTPKGVAVTHRSATNMVDPRQEYLRFGPDEVFLQLSPLAFDISALEIWGALTNGATLVIGAPSYQAIEELPAVLVEQRVTTLVLTPALFHTVMDTRPEALDGVRQLIVGGDVMSARRARAFLDRTARHGATLLNGYGPTEATTLVSTHAMNGVAAETPRVPLGEGIAGAALYLLDDDLRPVAPGGRGQVYIGGAVLARGYVRRPGLTAARFLPDPHASWSGARMYATGDEGVRSAAGLIEFVGRVDGQVKIRGYRVELGEVEQVLRTHEDVQDACVVPVKTLEQAEHLVGFVVPRAPAGRTDLAAELPAFASSFLPSYMVPGRFLSCPGLPLTPNGKVDRRQLTELAAQQAATQPRPPAGGPSIGTAAQAAFAEIWQSVLGVDHIGLDDDFFELGGTSLSAIRLVAAADERGLRLPLVTLLTERTVRGICAAREASVDGSTTPAA